MLVAVVVTFVEGCCSAEEGIGVDASALALALAAAAAAAAANDDDDDDDVGDEADSAADDVDDVDDDNSDDLTVAAAAAAAVLIGATNVNVLPAQLVDTMPFDKYSGSPLELISICGRSRDVKTVVLPLSH